MCNRNDTVHIPYNQVKRSNLYQNCYSTLYQNCYSQIKPVPMFATYPKNDKYSLYGYSFRSRYIQLVRVQ